MTDRTHSIASAKRRSRQSTASVAEPAARLAAAERDRDKLQQQLELRTQALERTQAQLQSLVDCAPNFIHLVDTDLRVTFINRGGSAFAPEDLIGTKIGEYMPPADRQRVRRRLLRVLKTGKPTQYEFAGLGENNTQSWYRTNAGPIDRDGTITGLVLITFDITEDRYRTEALLEGKRVAEAALVRDRALLNSIGEGLVVIDENGEIADTNPSAARLLGYQPEELIGRWFPTVMHALDDNGNEIHPLDRPALRALSSGEAISEVVRYRRKDGSYFPVAVTISPVVIDDRPVGAVEVFRDLTRERELEQAKEEFVSLASHQLRTPATGVKAYISMLLDGYAGDLRPRQRAFLQKVYDSNERQLQIVNDMLNVARLDAGRIVPEMVVTNLRGLIEDIVDEQRPTIRDRQQTLILESDKTAVEAVLDAKLIRMALENLVSNASKYTLAGGAITVAMRQTATNAIVVVRDTGIGIAKDDLPKLFRRFSRIDNPLSTQRGGTGLGLYLAQHIVLLHQGRMMVDSVPGKGTVFTVELPLGAPPRSVLGRTAKTTGDGHGGR
jgi:PAS domain S-box-containing protein